MAIQEITLYRNQNSTHTTINTSYNSSNNFPNPSDLEWSVPGYTFGEWNSERNG